MTETLVAQQLQHLQNKLVSINSVINLTCAGLYGQSESAPDAGEDDVLVCIDDCIYSLKACDSLITTALADIERLRHGVLGA